MTIIRYILQRLLILVPVLLGISLAAFALGRIAPGDPVDEALLRINVEFPTDEQRADMERQLGLDKPIPVQYLAWVGRVLSGDFGTSYITKRSVSSELMRRLPVTLTVSVAALFVAVVFGVGNGLIMSFTSGRLPDRLLQSWSTLLLSVPGFWLALLLIMLFAETLHILPTSGYGTLRQLILPAVVLSAANVGMTSRVTRSAMLTQLGDQYIVVARSKGLSERAVFFRHAFRNSLIPIITLIGNYFGEILGGSAIIESIFALPGLGSYVLTAIQNRDYPVIQGYVLFTGTIFVLVTILIDVLYIAVNPRIRVKGAGE